MSATIPYKQQSDASTQTGEEPDTFSSGHLESSSVSTTEVAILKDELREDGKYCFCRQAPKGKMLRCEAEKCKYIWLHQTCLLLSNKALKKIERADEDWICPECRGQGNLGKLMREKEKAQAMEKEREEQRRVQAAEKKKQNKAVQALAASRVCNGMKVDY